MWSLLLISIFLAPLQINPPEWTTDFDAAVEAAYESETEKFVFVLFTGSDWCIPCRTLKKKVFEKEVFWEYANHKLILVEVDFPNLEEHKLPKWQQKYNDSLADDYNPERIFPYIALINEHEELINQVFYKNEDAEKFVAKIKAAIR